MMIVKLLPGFFEEVGHGLALYQLSRIGRYGTGRGKPEVLNRCLLYDLLILAVAAEESTHALRVVNAQYLMYARLAQVETYQKCLAAKQGDDRCQVHRHEGLALTADGGGDGYHHGLIARSEIFQRGAYAPETLGQRAAGLLNDRDLDCRSRCG